MALDILENKMIEGFFGKYRFLSNFHPAQVVFKQCVYPSVEHAYQAAKSADTAVRARFQDPNMPAKEARRLGREIKLVECWENVKIDVMLDLLRQKFRHPDLRQKLLDTGNEELIEGNWWGDTFWGVCNGKGQNWLGKLLMTVRSELLTEVKDEPIK